MKRDIKEQRFNIVSKSNKLIQNSRFSLTTQQQKIVLFIISLINPWDEQFTKYRFEITEFCRLCGISPQGDMYELLKKQIKTISDKSVWIETEDGRETLLRWIEKPYIDRNSGTIEIKLDEDMKPYLLHLREKYTQYELIHTLMFKCKYSIRLYELLKSFHYNSLREYKTTIEINEFQKMLDSTYKNFKDFHKRALKPAQEEINKYSDIIFNYDFITEKGNKIKAIEIKVKSKPVQYRMVNYERNNLILDGRNG